MPPSPIQKMQILKLARVDSMALYARVARVDSMALYARVERVDSRALYARVERVDSMALYARVERVDSMALYARVAWWTGWRTGMYCISGWLTSSAAVSRI